MEESIEQIRTLWPNIQVTKEIIQKPTPEFVMQLYSNFTAAVEERYNFSLGWYQDNLKIDLDPEEVIYLKLRKINDITQSANVNIMLADIYDPSPIRTKHLIKMCLHIISYLENFSADFEKVNTNILEMKESTCRLANAKDQLLIEINEAAMFKGQLIQDIEKLKEETIEAEDNKEAYMLKRSKLVTEFQELRKTLEIHKRNVDEYKRSIVKLEEKEKQLLKESISNEEYINLKESIANLETEKESLGNDVINMEDLLSDQNRLLGNFKDCIKTLPENFNTDLVYKEINMERELKDMESEMINLLSELSSLKATHVHQKNIFTDSKNAFDLSDLENANLKEKLKKEMDNLSMIASKKNEELQINLKECLSENQNLKMKISQLENDLETLREHVSKEYIKIAKAEKRVFQKFKKT